MDPAVVLGSLEGRRWWVMEGCGRRVSAQLSSFCASCHAWHPLSSHIPVPGSSSPLPDRWRRGRTSLGSPGASETAGAAQGAAGARRLSGDFGEGAFSGTSATLPGWAPASSSPRPGGSPVPQRAGCPGGSALPFPRRPGSFHKERRKMQRSSWCCPVKGRERRRPRRAFIHPDVWVGVPG